MHKLRMGKGLESLLGKEESDFQEINLSEIEAGDFQTRKNFNLEQIQELAETIKSTGVLQPIIVYKSNNKFKIVSGERRFRASKIAQLRTIPAKVVNWTNEQILNANILENIQRSQLNGIEEALAYKKFMEEYNLTQEDISKKVGKSRSHIANLLRLLKLPEDVQESIISGKITIGHGKALLQKKKNISQEMNKIISEKKSIQKMTSSDSNEYDWIAENLSENIGFKVNIKKSGKSGNINIHFENDLELDDLLELFSKLKK